MMLARSSCWAGLVLSFFVVFGCGGGSGGGSTDAGAGDGAAGRDGGDGALGRDGGGGSGDDAGPAERDAGALDDAASDAGGDRDGSNGDGGSVGDDASGSSDACVPPPCAPPPEGCRYEGAGPCDCGTLVCDPAPGGCDPACAPGEYCDYAVGCSGAGTCRPYDPRTMCPLLYRPVCGCDGMTYSNACEATRAGVDVAHDGPCADGSCRTDADCPSGQHCQACRGAGGVIWVCLPDGVAC